MAQPSPIPAKTDLLSAIGKSVPDIIAPNLLVLFCGINPGLYSAFTGHHFARPGNRFWPTLFRAGFTDRQLAPAEERELLNHRFGITNLVDRATKAADELSPEELIAGSKRLMRKLKLYQPQAAAILGVSAYRLAFQNPKAELGEQKAYGVTRIWVLPNPSGLNAHYTPQRLAQIFRDFRSQIES